MVGQVWSVTSPPSLWLILQGLILEGLILEGLILQGLGQGKGRSYQAQAESGMS